MEERDEEGWERAGAVCEPRYVPLYVRAGIMGEDVQLCRAASAGTETN